MIAFPNIRIFDGESADLASGTVVVDGGTITAVGAAAVPNGAQVVDGGGRTLMPGLIDAHIHARTGPLACSAGCLDRGFTSVRDTGGADYGLHLAIERGYLKAPQLFYSEKALSQTGGHCDFRHHHPR